MGNRGSSQTTGINLPLVSDKPAGWLTIKEFADRMNMSTTPISQAVRNGKFHRDHLAKIKRERGAPSIIINWNASAYKWIVSKPELFWPIDFATNKKEEYKPIPVDNPEDAKLSGEHHVDDSGPVIDMHDAKLAHEKLKIQKLEREMRIADNQAINMVDGVAIRKQDGMEVRAALQAAIRKMVPKLCATGEPRKVERILQTHMAEALKTLKEDEETL